MSSVLLYYLLVPNRTITWHVLLYCPSSVLVVGFELLIFVVGVYGRCQEVVVDNYRMMFMLVPCGFTSANLRKKIYSPHKT